MVQIQDLLSKIPMRRWSKEEYLLGQAKHRSNIDPNDQSDLPRSFSDRYVYHKCTRKRGTPKYLRENCYHRIKCSVTNFPTALVRK